MSSINLLYQTQYAVNDKISILIPTVGEIVDNEDDYYGMVAALTSMPIDFMVQLDDIGIDFSMINEWDLFLLLFRGIQAMDSRLIFDGLQLADFEMAENTQNGDLVLVDRKHDVMIDRSVLNQIAAVLRKINHLEQNNKQPANQEAKDYLLQRARIKQRRNRNRKKDSELEALIIAMVNTEQFKYNFAETRDLTIYQFNESVRQVIKKVEYDNRMYGVYAGTIDTKKLNQDDLNWLTHK